ncbi:SGNH/GDSL hydrolase family protein [Marinilactibacillus psychrotolerans]|uniref:SGNH/GDSL hydrolase family protein n=1 Tax=Marinilactibacillus psychrotolerans TaxID=191770 RepID=UPI003884ECB2
MVFFGDSVTEFGNYPDIVAVNTGMTVHNIGLGGTRLSHHTDPYYDNFSLSKLIEAITNDDVSEQVETLEDENNTFSPKFKLHFNDLMEINFEEVDFISIFLGTNDYMGTIYGGNVPLGNESDTTRETFYGGINVAVDTLKENFPDVEIVFVTPTWRTNNEQLGGGSAEENANSSGYYLVDYVDALINRGDHYNIPTLDLYRESDINEETESKYLADDVHPNDEGFEHLGNLIGDFMIETYN